MKTPRFGHNLPYVEPLTPVALSSEIAPTLFSHKTLVNPLVDRYQSLMRTGKTTRKSVLNRKPNPRGTRRKTKILEHDGPKGGISIKDASTFYNTYGGNPKKRKPARKQK